MNRLLVTGATGFVGQWTLRHWRLAHPEVTLWATSDRAYCPQKLADELVILDLCDYDAVRDLVHACNPTHVIHLAGLVSEASLARYLAVNVAGTDHLYNALVETGCSTKVRVVQAGTAAIYGQITPDELPIVENHPLKPLTAYAISKMVQDYLAEMFWCTKELNVTRARIFNLLGPGQSDQLVPAAFIKQLKMMSGGESIRVGNLSARRDFVDVRDVVLAFDELLAGGQSGQAYNIGSGKSVAIRDVLEELISISGLRDIHITEEPLRMRKSDVPDVVADIAAIEDAVAWNPQISLSESLEYMYKYEHDANDSLSL